MSDVITLGVENTNDVQRKLINTAKKRVLIIEDIGEMRLMLKSLMTSMGYSDIDVEALRSSRNKACFGKAL
ncbi:MULTISPECIES: hypothetical protein [Marinomonas]|uniref:Response regulatory domain-containing protein n=1 Tax=Marinomonas rhodophyticola TaxID=2992803 RepID=A0ABT3KBA9_9GAMM|nr:hypothetical protein [Marinomonas sp. KJ51-3]MCW4627788.1 hypothetical protein [Marinomonas sp. KJ51-3]